MHPDEAIARLAETQLGFFTRRDALRAELSPQQIRGRLRARRWIAVFRGVYRIAGWQPAYENLIFAAHLAAGSGTAAAGASASRLWSLPGSESFDGFELAVQGRRRVRVPGIVVRRPRDLRRSDVTRIGIVPVTTAGRTLIDLATALTPARLEDCLDDVLRRGLASTRALLRRLDGVRSAGSGALRGLVLERHDHGATESVLETEMLRLIRARGLPDPVRQHVITTPRGTAVARVDLAYPAARIAIEVDGYAYHSSRRRFDADHEREHRLRECGWVVLAFTSHQIRGRPDLVARRIGRALTEQLPGSQRAPAEQQLTPLHTRSPMRGHEMLAATTR
jgi:very-short-patch-repair endonuclease